MYFELGQILGSIIIILYILTALNYVIKFINKKFRNKIKKNEKVLQVFNRIMRFIVKNHRLFGMLTIFALLLHFFVQYNQYGLSVTGGLAASILVLQVALGIYGFKTKKIGGAWLMAHRTIAVVLLVTIGMHIL